ncbi:hypothetical protein IAU60_002257 [Kwoniella sp. DSM 27419]
MRSIWLAAVLAMAWLPNTNAQSSSTASATTSAATTSTAPAASTSTMFSNSSTTQATRTYAFPSLPTTVSLPPLNTSQPVIQLDLPFVSSLYLTFSICSLTDDSTLLPTILLTTADRDQALDEGESIFDLGSRTNADALSGGTRKGYYNRRNGKNGDVWGLTWDKGFANWTLSDGSDSDDGDDSGYVRVSVLVGLGLQADGITVDMDGEDAFAGGAVVQMSASADAPLRGLSPALPLLGDTTSTLALIFSPLLAPLTQPEPSYPNYTLPSPQLVFEPFSTISSSLSDNSSLATTNLTLLVVPTASSPTNEGLDNSYCAAQLAVNSTHNLASSVVLQTSSGNPEWSSVGGQEGYRHHWVIGGLTAETNYTAWIVDDNGVMSGPIWFATKQDSFPCPLALPTSTCPSIAYAAALPLNSTSVSTESGDLISSTSPVQRYPEELTLVLTSNLEAFSTSLLSRACGRDLYSQVSTCADCFSSYRDWLCRMVIPQCATPGTKVDDGSDDPNVFPATPYTIHRTPSSPRNSALPQVIDYEYDELLPCLSTCYAVDRTCPVNMAFRCPKRYANAELSYAFIGPENDEGDGSGINGAGVAASDRWGGRWCNG